MDNIRITNRDLAEAYFEIIVKSGGGGYFTRATKDSIAGLDLDLVSYYQDSSAFDSLHLEECGLNLRTQRIIEQILREGEDNVDIPPHHGRPITRSKDENYVSPDRPRILPIAMGDVPIPPPRKRDRLQYLKI